MASEKHVITSASGKKYYPVIGLEIHAELKTKSKMFCSCKNDADEAKPNVNICPICMGHPGTLPTLNKEAIKHVLKVGTALGSKVADYTEWDRKNYFYPDIPKGYQISQYAYPLIRGGGIKVVTPELDEKGKAIPGAYVEDFVELTRIHLEEDTASSSHDHGTAAGGEAYSLVDFNRAGLPLMELVTEPVIHDAKTAAAFAKELQQLLRALGAGDANMEKGEMRVEANISVSTDPRAHELPYDLKTFGTKVEVKNLNSFRSAERAIEYELERHIDLIERGEGSKIIQETRGFDETTGKTFSQRAKESSHDYRYFPDPDLPKLFVSEVEDFDLVKIKSALPELPWDRRARYKADFGMKDEDAEMFVQNTLFREFFEETAAHLKNADATKTAVNYTTSDIAGLSKKFNTGILIPSRHFSEIITMIGAGELSSRGAKDLIALYWDNDETAAILSKGPKATAEEKGMIQKNDPEALKKMIEELIAANPNVVADYKAGKEASLQFFVGQIMKLTKGSVNPQLAKQALMEIISK